jgi:hypothetical protein
VFELYTAGIIWQPRPSFALGAVWSVTNLYKALIIESKLFLGI